MGSIYEGRSKLVALDGATRGTNAVRQKTVAIIGSRGYPSFYGGFETLVRKIAPFLSDRGWAVNVYCRPGATVDDDQYRCENIRTITTKGVESKSLSTLSFGATSVLDAAKRRPDVALVMNVANGYWLPLLRARRIPSVVNVDGIEWQRDKWSRAGKAVFRIGAGLTARYGDMLIADSKQIGAFWSTQFDRDSVFIPYGGDPPAKGLPPVEGWTRRRYVLLVARLVPENTIAEFLDAAKNLADSHPVVIVGSSGSGGALEQNVRSLAESHQGVTWLGHVSDDQMLYSLWRNCGAYFHGHSVGGTNPALVQAMACGAPIVARDTRFNREVLQETGLFVEGSAHGIERGIRKMLSDPQLQESLGLSAQERALDAYSWDAVCASYENSLDLAITTYGKQ